MSNNTHLLLIITVFFISCSRDSFEPVEFDCTESFTYDNQIKQIIDSSCSYSGCHDGGGGIGPLDYTNYEGMLTHLQDGSFRSRVILERDNIITGMPPNIGIYEQSMKSDLTEEELNMISCWLEADFPKN